MAGDIVSAIRDRGGAGSGRPGQGGLRNAQAYRQYEAEQSTDSHVPVDDVASILDMASDGLPAPVQTAITLLTGEIERLRADLDHAHHHESLLADQADRHSFLPLLNQHAFQRSVAKLLVQSERVGLPGSLIFVHLLGLEAIYDNLGMDAAAALLAHAAGLIRAEIDALDSVGYLDCGAFAAGLAGQSEEEAKNCARRIEERLKTTACLWRGQILPYRVTTGAVAFRFDQDAKALIEAADAARRQRNIAS